MADGVLRVTVDLGSAIDNLSALNAEFETTAASLASVNAASSNLSGTGFRQLNSSVASVQTSFSAYQTTIRSAVGTTEAFVTVQNAVAGASSNVSTFLGEQKNATVTLTGCETQAGTAKMAVVRASEAQSASSRRVTMSKDAEKASTIQLNACERAEAAQKARVSAAAARRAAAARAAQAAKDDEKASTTQLNACERAEAAQKARVSAAAARVAEAERVAQAAKDAGKESTTQLTACERAEAAEKARLNSATAITAESERALRLEKNAGKEATVQLTACERAEQVQKGRLDGAIATTIGSERSLRLEKDASKESTTRLNACERAAIAEKNRVAAASARQAEAERAAQAAKDAGKEATTRLTACERALAAQKERTRAAAAAEVEASVLAASTRNREKIGIANLTRCQNALATASSNSANVTERALGTISGSIRGLFRVAPLLTGAVAAFSVINVARQLSAIEQSTIELRLAAESAQEYSENLDFLRRLSVDTGQDLSTLARTFGLVAFAADRSTESIQDIRDQFSGFGRTAAVSGITGQSFRQLFVTLEQITASGRILGRQVAVITNRVPNFFRAATAATGRTEAELRDAFRTNAFSREELINVLSDTGRELDRIVAPQFEGANRTITIAARGVSASFLSLADAAFGVTEGATRGTGIVGFLDSITASFMGLVPVSRDARMEISRFLDVLTTAGEGAGISGFINTILTRLGGIIRSIPRAFGDAAAVLENSFSSLREARDRQLAQDEIRRLGVSGIIGPETQLTPTGLPAGIRERAPGLFTTQLFGGQRGQESSSAILDAVPVAINRFVDSIPDLLNRSQDIREVGIAIAREFAGATLRDALTRPLIAGARASALALSGATISEIRQEITTIGGTFAPLFDTLFGLEGAADDAMTRTATNTMETSTNTARTNALLAAIPRAIAEEAALIQASGVRGSVSPDRVLERAERIARDNRFGQEVVTRVRPGSTPPPRPPGTPDFTPVESFPDSRRRAGSLPLFATPLFSQEMLTTTTRNLRQQFDTFTTSITNFFGNAFDSLSGAIVTPAFAGAPNNEDLNELSAMTAANSMASERNTTAIEMNTMMAQANTRSNLSLGTVIGGLSLASVPLLVASIRSLTGVVNNTAGILSLFMTGGAGTNLLSTLGTLLFGPTAGAALSSGVPLIAEGIQSFFSSGGGGAATARSVPLSEVMDRAISEQIERSFGPVRGDRALGAMQQTFSAGVTALVSEVMSSLSGSRQPVSASGGGGPGSVSLTGEQASALVGALIPPGQRPESMERIIAGVMKQFARNRRN